MQKKIQWKPESIDNVSWRVKVIGGWIVGQTVIGSMVFVPDRDHEWCIIPPVIETKEEEKESISEGY